MIVYWGKEIMEITGSTHEKFSLVLHQQINDLIDEMNELRNRVKELELERSMTIPPSNSIIVGPPYACQFALRILSKERVTVKLLVNSIFEHFNKQKSKCTYKPIVIPLEQGKIKGNVFVVEAIVDSLDTEYINIYEIAHMFNTCLKDFKISKIHMLNITNSADAIGIVDIMQGKQIQMLGSDGITQYLKIDGQVTETTYRYECHKWFRDNMSTHARTFLMALQLPVIEPLPGA